MPGNIFKAFSLSTEFVLKLTFSKKSFRNTISHTVWTQIRAHILSGLFWVNSVCKGHQQMKKTLTLAAKEFKNLFVALFQVAQVQLIIICIVCDDYLIRYLRVFENSLHQKALSTVHVKPDYVCNSHTSHDQFSAILRVAVLYICFTTKLIFLCHGY